MMNSLFIGTLTFLIVAPAISICDEDLSKATTSAEQHQDPTSGDFVTQHPFETNHMQALHDPWSFYRQIRAPSGFVGMRGKKFYHSMVDEDDYFESQPKRQPSQAFFGMRGKKFYDEKRAPSSFYGMRGKKDDVEDGNNDNDLQSADFYTQLLNDRAKLEEFLDDYFESRNFEGEKVKRQPSGFVGMRGKKSVNNDDYFEFEKRAPMGFQGVRGKKSEFPDYIGSEDKRAPLGGFFGMRGKKQPFGRQQSNFFGVRKKPYMQYAKFVGVRGKKAGDDSIMRLHLDSAEFDDNFGLRNAQRVQADGSQTKRIGFIGMRG